MSSPKIAQLSWPAEIFYRRLMSVVDDFGRYHATPMLLRAGCYPLQLDKVSDSDISKWLGETRKAGLVRVYESGATPYLELLNFHQQVRAKGSKYPQPPADATQMHSTCNASVHLDVVVVEDVVEGSVAPSAPPVLEMPLVDGTQMPITEAMVSEWGSAFPAVDVLQQLREMRAWCIANPANRKTARGVPKFVVRWLSKEQDRAPKVSTPKQDLGNYR